MNLAEIDLNLLLALDALLAERNLTRAGRRLGLSQPSMSRALEQLRRIFDDDLLVRIGREYQLTILAQELEQPLATALSMLDETVRHRLTFDATRDERVFRIASSHEAVLLVLKPLIERLSTRYQPVSLLLRPLNGSFTVRDLEAGRLDLAIWPSGLRAPELIDEPLYEDRWVLAMWRGAPYEPGLLTRKELAERVIAHDADVHDYTGLDRSGLAMELPSLLNGGKPRLTFTNPSLRLLLLRGTSMIDVAHEKLARHLMDVAELKMYDVPFETEAVGMSMLWHGSRSTDPATNWLREQIRDIVAAPDFGTTPLSSMTSFAPA